MATVHHRYAIYVQDYGAPVGWRLALADPHAISAIISQSGNGYEAGFTEEFWKPVREYWQDQSPRTEAAIRQALTPDAIRWQYLHGVRDKSLLESHLDAAADSICRFLERTLP